MNLLGQIWLTVAIAHYGIGCWIRINAGRLDISNKFIIEYYTHDPNNDDDLTFVELFSILWPIVLSLIICKFIIITFYRFIISPVMERVMHKSITSKTIEKL